MKSNKKTYVFLTNSLGGYSGGPSYVRNKTIWLKSKGWNVIAFDSTGMANASILFDELKCFSENRIKELFYLPAYYKKVQCEKVINEIIRKIGNDNASVVVESNTIELSYWGEIIAEKVKAKHLIYLIAENIIISNKNHFDFLSYKAERNELFSISKKAYITLFSKYRIVPDDEAESHYWNSMSYIKAVETPMPGIENLKTADYTICHFGRYKDYLPEVIKELSIYVEQEQNSTFNIVFWGISFLRTDLEQLLTKAPNANVYYFDSVFPIPNALFKISDVVIATAGCAIISFGEGVKTISMNVETQKPLGVMGYTTNQISFSCNEYPDSNKTLSHLLKELLKSNSYSSEPTLQLEVEAKGYNYQLSFVSDSNNWYKMYLDMQKPCLKSTLIKFLLNIGLINVISYFRYQKYSR